MIEVVIKIDCEKTERALNGLSVILGQTVGDIIKDNLNLNEVLISMAKAIKRKDDLEGWEEVFGEKAINDLLMILE